MSSLFGSTNAYNTTKYTQMQLQTSAYGVVIPVVYGTTRIGWNLADYLDFKAFTTPGQSGGKGGIIGGGGKGSQSYSYSATILGALCEGPINGIFSSWLSQTQAAGTPNFDLFEGTIAQTPWSYLSSNYPTHALTYSGFAYLAAENYGLGTSANLPNMNWEVQGFFNDWGTYGAQDSQSTNLCAAGGDADPSLVIPDMLTNEQYGMGFPANRVGQVTMNTETHVIPSSGPYTVTVSNAAGFQFNVNLLDVTSGNLMTCTSGSPVQSEYYAFASTGVYTFAAADAGKTVSIRYASAGPMSTYQSWCLATGLWISPAYDTQTQMSSLIDDLATATFSEVVWSSGVLQMIPRGSQPVSGNGYSYSPPGDPLFSLTPDDFQPNTNPTGTSASVSDDPVIVTRLRTSDQLNDVKIEYLDRANQYAPAIAEAIDQYLVDAYGRRPGASKSLHMLCDANAANLSAKLQLQDQYIRNTYSFQLDERFIILDPMDIVEVTDPYFPGMTNVAVRLLTLTENDDGTISITAEEYPGTIGTVPEFVVDVGAGLIQDFNVDPGDAAEPAVFDVPVQLSQVIGLQSWLATMSATGNPNWGGCDVYISSDSGGPFTKQATLEGPSRMGPLTASIAAGGGNPDTTHTLSVDLTDCDGQLQSGTNADAAAGNTLCFVDGEYLSYATATLTSTFKYDLTYLYRGQWGSQNSSHLSGTQFVRIDDQTVRIPYTPAQVGQTFYIKLVSFNIFGGGYQNISSVTTYSHTIGGPPTFYAPESLVVTASLKSAQLNWINAPNIGQAAVNVWRSSTSFFADASQIGSVANYGTTFTDINATSGTPYWYWIQAQDISGNLSSFEPATSGAGVTATTLQAVTQDLGAGQVTTTVIAASAVTGRASEVAPASFIPATETLLTRVSVTADGMTTINPIFTDSIFFSAPGDVTYNLYRDFGGGDQTLLGTSQTQLNTGDSVGTSISGSDTPGAGTYTYDVTYQDPIGGAVNQSNSPSEIIVAYKR